MVSIPKRNFQSYLAKPHHSILLVCGPEQGLVRDTVQHILKTQMPEDPLALITLDQQNLAEDPQSLADEIFGFSMFAASKVIHLRDPDPRNLTSQLKGLLGQIPDSVTLVIEAGDLKKTSALRKMLESYPQAGVLVCYPEEMNDKKEMVRSLLKDHHLSIETDTLSFLVAHLSAEHAVNKQELEKLSLYCYGNDSVTIDDIEACLIDSQSHQFEQCLDLCWSGHAQAMDSLSVLRFESRPASVLSTMVERQCLMLLELKGKMTQRSASEVVKSARPPVFFKRQPLVITMLTLWSGPMLEALLKDIRQTTAQSRLDSHHGMAMLERLLIKIFSVARKNTPQKF
jgi:DNA polymerase-3 subunit delta